MPFHHPVRHVCAVTFFKHKMGFGNYATAEGDSKAVAKAPREATVR